MSDAFGHRDFLRTMIRITSTTTPQAIEISSQDMLATPVYRFRRSALDQALFLKQRVHRTAGFRPALADSIFAVCQELRRLTSIAVRKAPPT
jgi:hypothetical protein